MKNRKAKTDTIYPVARVLELPNCPSLPFRVIMSMQDVGGRDFAEYKVHHYFATSNAVFVDNCIVCKSTTSVTRIFLWRHDATNFRFLKSIYRPMDQTLICKKSDSCRRGVNVNEKEYFTITAYKVVFFICLFLFRPSATNRYQFIYRLVLIIDNNR